ncbi:MAG: hypothetical protein EOP83_17510 [Verrucomicrobiaceae bacterium]|nr:MAG: hypothetical protein EOP83_17510 [Verrucomicrobiaceae bacterium]
MDMLINNIGLILALGVVPALYLAFLSLMRKRNVHRHCYPAYFYLFGIAGGYCLAVGLSPSGLAAACMVFLITVAPLACFIASMRLKSCQNRGRFENVAMILGYVYSGLIMTTFVGGILFSRP